MIVDACVTVQTLFAPDDDTQGAFLQWAGKASRSVHVLIYGFHLPKFTDLLIAKHQAGLQVQVILDHSQAQGQAEAGEVQRLVAAGVDTVIGTSPVSRQILHSKFTIIDGEWVEDGSWNYSLSASAQANTMNFVQSAQRAAAFLAAWQRLRSWILTHEAALQPARPAPPGP